MYGQEDKQINHFGVKSNSFSREWLDLPVFIFRQWNLTEDSYLLDSTLSAGLYNSIFQIIFFFWKNLLTRH